jgi:hypothetical protein
MPPEKYIAHTLTMFPGATMVLLVTPGPDRTFSTHLQTAQDLEPSQALELMANAQTMLTRQTGIVVAAVAEAAGLEQEKVMELYASMVEDQQAQTDANDEARMIGKKKPRLVIP